MTCQTSSGNGCSLEDCYTNLFALADLTGIKWRRLRSETSTLFTRPLEDPVLITYIKCLQAEILCAWAKVQYSYGDMPKAANQLGYKRELWIFWYGDEPANLDTIVPKELVEVESGSWDGGMSYECRTFIFKALHNRIERCLLSKKYVRLGRWFVQPHENYNDASVQLSFSFQNFSLHGDSTVCASVDVERHQPLLLVNEQHLHLARCCSPTGIPVILAPYNLAGVLIGQSPSSDQDVTTKSLLQEWQDFYPMDRCSWSGDGALLQAPELPGGSDLSPLLDVVVAGVHMRYPAQYVLIPKDYLSPPVSSASMPAAAGCVDAGASDLLPLADDANGMQTAQQRAALQPKTGLSCSGVRPRPPAPAVDGVVQKTFEEACILSAKRAPISSSSAAGAGANQSDDEQGQWSLCDPSTKHNCVCGRQTNGACKSSMQPVIGGRGGPNVSAARQICANPAAPGKQLKVERENSVTQALPVKKLSFHRRLQRSAIPSAGTSGERLATFSCYSSHRRKVKDSASPLSAVASPACVGGPQSIPAAERIMPTLSPQNPSRDTANPAASESQSSRQAPHSSNQSGTTYAAIPQTLTEPSAHVPCIQGLFAKLPQDLVTGMPSAAFSSHMQAERLKRPHLPVHPALDGNRVIDGEDLSTPSLYDFDPSDDWLAHPIKKLKLLPDLQPEGLVASTSQRKAMPYSLVCLTNHATPAAMAATVQVKGNANAAGGQHLPVTETSVASAAYDVDQRPAASPRMAAPAASTVPVSSSPVDEPKSARPVISPSSPMTLPFGTGLKSVNSLQPKLSDLDNIFDADEEMDSSLSPDGVHSTDCFPNEHGKGSSLMSAVVNGTIGVSELCQMFPTPPSLEGCLALSPAGCHDGFGAIDTHCQSQSAHYYDVATGSSSATSTAFTKCDEKQDSPTRFVRTPQLSKYVTCAKYAPIDLPSSKLLPASLQVSPQWYNADAKLGRSQLTPSLLPKPPAEVTPVSTAQQPISSFNPENNLFFIPPSPSPVLMGFDNPSPASSSLTRKVGAIPTPVDASVLGAAHANIRNGTALSEANSLVVNIMLSDSLLNLFKDASFDSCNICICNTNIKGTDVGLYLPDPVKEAQYRCTCGFSAAVNRSNGYCSGLFYEDEADITGIRDDRFDDHRLPLDPAALAIRENATSSDTPLGPTENNKNVMLIEHCAITYSTSFLASQKIPSTISRIHATAAFSPNAEKRLNLYRSDVSSILLAALEAGRTAAGGSMAATDLNSLLSAKAPACLADWPLPPQVVPSLQAPSKEWLEQPKSTRSADVMAALKGLQHVLQEACHKKRSTRLWDSSYVVNGPLTWKDFHKLAWRGSEDACKPQPIPSILVGSDKDWVSYSPFVLKYWENLLLRPYGRTHNMAYVVLTPDCGSSSSSAGSTGGILSSIRTFFRELSTMYETCQLGRHIPLDRSQNQSDGIIQLGRKTAAKLAQQQQQQAGSEADSQKSGGAAAAGGSNCSWINSLGDDALSKKLKLYAQTFQYILAPLLSQQPLDKSLFESTNATKSTTQLLVPPAGVGAARPGSGMLAPQPASSTPTHVGAPSSYSLPGQDAQEDRTGDSACLAGSANDILRETEDSSCEDSSLDDIGLAVYIVEDVTFASCNKLSSLLGGGGSKIHWPAAAPKQEDEDEDDDERCSSTVGVYGVLRCYHEFLASLPETVRSRVQLQIVPLSMVTHMLGGTGDGAGSSSNFGQLSLMKDLCFSVYTQCQHSMAHVPTGRALTSFGPLVSGAAGSSPTASKIYLAPYILAPQKDVQARLGSNYATDGTCGGGVLLCAYCLSEDQRWLLASVTDDSGELRCTKAINMAITDRSRRKRSLAVHRHGLQKLFDFLLDTIARTCMSWRIVIGRLGRLGHEELKVWATLLNHKCLIRANVRMRGDDCRPCSFVPSATDTPTIVSACVTSLEPHKSFKILTDAVRRPPTHKDKHHTATVASSMSSAMLAGGSAVAGNGGGGALGARLLSTPEDVSCTHILVIPNSTTAGGSQSHHDAQLDLPPDLTDDVGIFDFKEDDLDMLFALGESPGHTMDSPVGRDSMGETNSGMGGISNSLTNAVGLMRGVSTSGGNPGSRSTAGSAPGVAGVNSDGPDEVSPNLLQQPLAMGYYLSTAPAGALPAWFWATCPQEEGACPTSLKFALHFHSFLQQQHQDELVGSTSAASQNRSAASHPLDSSSTCDVLRFVLETYDKLSWLTVDACTNNRQSCLPVHVSHLVQLSQAIAVVAAAVNCG